MKNAMKNALALTLAVLMAVCCLSPAVYAETSAASVSARDASGDYDAASAVTLSPGDDLTITAAGTYILSGIYENQMIVVAVSKEDKIQLVLDNAELINANGPAIYVRSADKVFLTAVEGTVNTISDDAGYTLTDGDTTIDAAVFSKDDLTINGAGQLTINGKNKHAVVSKDDLVVTSKDLTINAVQTGLTGKESVTLSAAAVSILAGSDGIHTEGSVLFESGSYNIQVRDDGIHADEKVEIVEGALNIIGAEGIESTYVLISGGDITIQATDDGINAARKSNVYAPTVEITGGTVAVTMGAGDTDGIDSNGDIIISGGIISVNGNSAFDYDGSASFAGGTVYVNGQQVTTLPNQMMGGRAGRGGMGGFGGNWFKQR